MTPIFLLKAFPALGTLWWIEVFDNLNTFQINQINQILINEIQKFENKYSRFIKESELNNLNFSRELNNPSEDLIKMCKIGIDISNKTNGIFNLMVGGYLEKNGYGDVFNKKDLKDQILDMREILLVSPDKISLIKKGYNLDLGGIGKGYLIDKIKNILLENDIKFFLVNGGGDIYATTDNGKPLTVYLEDPINLGTYLGSIDLKNNSMCASSPYKRSWVKDKNTFSHIISPNSNQEIFSSFVVSDSVVLSDCLATCLCIDPNILQNHNNLVESYLVIDKGNYIVSSYNFVINE